MKILRIEIRRCLLFLMAVFFLFSCDRTTTTPSSTTIIGESVVLVGTEPSTLAFTPSPAYQLAVRSTYKDNLPETIRYREGIDYVWNRQTGEISRTLNSRIPDFSENVLYNKNDFKHDDYPGYTNKPYLIYVSYIISKKLDWPKQLDHSALLSRTRNLLLQGERVTIVAFGDSITAGGETSSSELIYWERWLQSLRIKYPNAIINGVNSGKGGATAFEGVGLIEKSVFDMKPDLVLIAFGMNDHIAIPQKPKVEERVWRKLVGALGYRSKEERIYSARIEKLIYKFELDLRRQIDLIRSKTEAEIVLISAPSPNPKWHYATGQMKLYAKATERVAASMNCAYADVNGNWESLAARLKPEDLFANNINHPSDFGHWIYFRVLEHVGL